MKVTINCPELIGSVKAPEIDRQLTRSAKCLVMLLALVSDDQSAWTNVICVCLTYRFSGWPVMSATFRICFAKPTQITPTSTKCTNLATKLTR